MESTWKNGQGGGVCVRVCGCGGGWKGAKDFVRHKDMYCSFMVKISRALLLAAMP
jgi:hypothetical protein